MFRKYCDEYSKIIRRCAEIIENNMVHDDYSTVPLNSYKEGSLAFVRLADFLKRFVPANQALIQDHRNKL